MLDEDETTNDIVPSPTPETAVKEIVVDEPKNAEVESETVEVVTEPKIVTEESESVEINGDVIEETVNEPEVEASEITDTPTETVVDSSVEMLTVEEVEVNPEVTTSTLPEVPAEPKQQIDVIPEIESTESPAPVQSETTKTVQKNVREKRYSDRPKVDIENEVQKRQQKIIGKLLEKARATIQLRKLKKINRILELFNTQKKITNEDVQKLLRVSDRTATRYFDVLEEKGRIQQVGDTGRSVYYIKTR